ncbi:MAG: VWA domain-containing protein [Gammaproteobacteria bacterium]|nr:VWA domain-containing protein [Gammaproteobacteria bacterium]
MDSSINRFIYLLKRNGVRISPSESIDAMLALGYVPLDDKETLRTVLRSTLVKDVHDLSVFEELFELFFSWPKPDRHTDHGHGHDHHHHDDEPKEPERMVFEPEDRGITDPEGQHPHGQPVEIRDYFDPDKMVTRFNPHQDPNQLSLSALSQNLILNRNKGLLDKVMKRVTHQMNVRRVKNLSQAGELNFNEGLETLDADLVVGAMEELLDDLRDMQVDEQLVNQLASQIDGIIANLPELLKRYIEREMALQKDKNPQPEPEVDSAYDYHFGESERREMEEIVRRLGRHMRGARSYRRFISHRGRISIAHTLRRNMMYEGIPFSPVLTSRRDEKPRLVVICDVSLSVRNTARFMLHLLYSLQSLFEQVRSYAFVSDLVDVSQYFEQLDLAQAIGTVFSGELLDVDANSNYGQAFEIFCQRHLAVVTQQSTVIILGDGRGNRNPPNAGALETIRHRAKQLLWLSPEPRGSWGLGSSDMPLYEPICHRAEVVRNLKQLGQVTEDLIRRSLMSTYHA